MTETKEAVTKNQVAGTWRIVSAEVEQDGKKMLPFGPHPSGILSFTTDMHYVEVLTDPAILHFASDDQGGGTEEENRTVMAKTIGLFGTYTVDENGNLTGDKVEGCTFPNWVGDVRTTKEISATVDGDRMQEQFHRPDGSTIYLVWRRLG